LQNLTPKIAVRLENRISEEMSTRPKSMMEIRGSQVGRAVFLPNVYDNQKYGFINVLGRKALPTLLGLSIHGKNMVTECDPNLENRL
jgi:hypothetical protein